MAATQRARTQDVRPAGDKAPAAASRTPTAGGAAGPVRSLMPSPQVAAAILDSAQKTPRVQEKAPQKRPAAAPPPVSSEKSPARVKVAEPVSRLSTARTALQPPRVAASALALVSRSATPGAAQGPRAPTKPAAATGAMKSAEAGVAPAPAAAQAAAKATGGPAAAEPTSKAPSPATPLQGPAAAPAAAAPLAAPETAPTETAPPSEAAPESKTEAPAPGEAKKEAKEDKEGKEGKGKEAKGDKEGKAAAGEAPAEESGGGGAGPATLALKMPAPPTEPSKATKRRIAGVQRRAGGTAVAQAKLPEGDAQVGDARGAVDQPDAEALAKAKEQLIAALGEQPKPSPEIVKLCERIREVIRNKRPPDEDALMEAKPEGEALDAGNQLNSTVQDETKKVEGTYGAINEPPAAAPPEKGAPLPDQPPAAKTPGLNAATAAPDPVPEGNVSLDADAAASKQKMTDAGMDKPTAQLVQSGPIAEARGAQGELEQTAKDDPATVLAKQKDSLAKAETDMASLQEQALAALTVSRAGTSKKAAAGQKGMVESEASTRARVSAEAQQIFNDAQKAVNDLLKPLVSNAMAEWEAAKTVLVTQFKNDLAVVQREVDERHSGVGGFFVGLWDAVTGLPDWAEEAYSKAEYNFSEGVIAKITKISTDVNTVIATCELLIKTARDRIAQLFEDNKAALGEWAETEKGKFDKQLDNLQAQAIATRDNFNKDLIERSASAVDEVRTEIAELRKKAAGLLGRIANAIGRFLDDPIKFIIEGLLDLLGIPPPAFWAVVAKIKKVISDIADDPLGFASNLLSGLAQGFSLFFENFGKHMLKGFINWLTGGLASAGVELPKDLSLKSIITFFLQLMGITWPRIRKVLAKHVGEKNVALLEKVYSMVSLLIEKGPEGIFEMIQEKLSPQAIVDQVIQLAVDYMVSAIIKAATARIIMLFNPVGAILQALEAIYRVLKWVFQNAAKIFTLVETVVNGIADILAGNIGGFAAAVEKGLAMLIAPVISFIADYLGFGDLPQTIAEKIKSFQEWIMGLIDQALGFLVEKGKALLAALGIGKKDEKDKKDGTPHEQAVAEVAETLAEPPPGDPLGYDALRAAKEQEAQTIVAARNQSLAAEHVKMSVTFTEKAQDQQDDDLDFTVLIEPNTAKKAGKAPVTKAEPIAGEHRVVRDPAITGEVAESHHVPARALGTAISQFLYQVAERLRKGSWKGNAAAARIAKAFEDRAKANEDAAKSPGFKLSAILVDEAAHRGEEGVHKIDATGAILEKLANNPADDAIVLVKRQTETEIRGVASYVSVNPQTASWRVFLSDIRRSFDEKGFRSDPRKPRDDTEPVTLILATAEKKFMDAEMTAEEFLSEQVVDRTNEVLDRGVEHAYTAGSATVMAAIARAKVGTAKGRSQAQSNLRDVFDRTWSQFRSPIVP